MPAGAGLAMVFAIGDRPYCRALRQQGCEWLGHLLERQLGIFDAAGSYSPLGPPFALSQNAVAWRPGSFRRECHSTENHNRITIRGAYCLLLLARNPAKKSGLPGSRRRLWIWGSGQFPSRSPAGPVRPPL